MDSALMTNIWPKDVSSVAAVPLIAVMLRGRQKLCGRRRPPSVPGQASKQDTSEKSLRRFIQQGPKE